MKKQNEERKEESMAPVNDTLKGLENLPSPQKPEKFDYSQDHAVLEIITKLNRESERFPRINDFIFNHFGRFWTSETKEDYNKEARKGYIKTSQILQMIEDKREVYGELIKRDGLREDTKLRKIHQMVTCEELINEIKQLEKESED